MDSFSELRTILHQVPVAIGSFVFCFYCDFRGLCG